MGRNSPMHQYMLGANWLESTFAEKDLQIGHTEQQVARKPVMCCCIKEDQ